MAILPATRQWSLKTQIAGGVALLLSLLLVAHSWLLFVDARDQLKQGVTAQMATLTARVAQELDEKVALRQAYLQAMGQHLPRELLRKDEAIEQFFRRQNGAYTLFDDLYLFSPTGLLRVDWPPVPGRRGLDMSERDYIQGAIRNHTTTLSRPILGKVSKQPMVVVSVPLLDAEGKLEAILGGVINLQKSRMLEPLVRTSVGQTGYFALVGPDRLTLVHPDKERLLKPIAKPGANPSLDRALDEGYEGVAAGQNSKGLQALFSFKRLENTRWLLAAMIPADEAYASVNQLTQRFFLLTLLALSLILPLVVVLVRRFTRPLEQFHDHLRNNQTLTLPPPSNHGSRETDQLMEAYGQFVAQQQTTLDELERARQTAEAASRAKSEFLANVSHELRTPLNGIIGMTELALLERISPEARGYLGDARLCADSLLLIINDVLDFSQLESGRLTVEHLPTDIRATLNQATNVLRLKAEEKKLALTVTLDERIPTTVYGDPGRLRQILVNLIGNGVKFTEAGEISVTVSREDDGSDPAHCQLHFQVADTGVGIPEDRLKTIFEAFSQADNTITRRYGGVGLGLTLCARLLPLMGGRIWVESTPGQGSTFHVHCPFGLLKPAN